MNLAEAQDMCNYYIDMHLRGQGWTMTWNRRRSSFGLCCYATKTIELSRPLTSIETQDHVKDTILHEIAHALAGPGTGHGSAWRAHARRIGVKNVSSRSPLSKGVKPLDPKYVMIDPEGNIIRRYNRRPNAGTYQKLPFMYMPGRYNETRGQIRIIPYTQYQQCFAEENR